jgi:hypothetical protein
LEHHVNSSAHNSALESGRAPERSIHAWIREHGNANNMTLLSSTEVPYRAALKVYTVTCGTCSMELRVTRVNNLQHHVDSAAHISALKSGRGRETKVIAWVREPGDTNTKTQLPNAEVTSNGTRVYTVLCGICNTERRVMNVQHLEGHVGSAVHISALDGGSKVDAWFREHGAANKMTLSNGEVGSKGKRVPVAKCDACHKCIRATNVVAHAASTQHIAALASGTGRPAMRKRPRC